MKYYEVFIDVDTLTMITADTATERDGLLHFYKIISGVVHTVAIFNFEKIVGYREVTEESAAKHP